MLARVAPAAVVVLFAVACASPFEETQPCPSLSYARDVVYVLGGELPLSGDVDGELPTSGPRFRAHPVAVPAGGELTLSLTLDIRGGPDRPVLYAYGPRDSAGLFGGCTAEAVGTSLSVVIPKDAGGEWLVLVGADPLDDAKGTYTLTATCEGDNCSAAACPALLASSCTTEVCPTGFATATADGLTCPTCTCEQPECGAFRTRVFDTCVCDCQVPLNPAPVCGLDGVTYTTACFANCNEVPVARADGACETQCPGLTGCALDCPDGYVLENGCPTCQCAASCDATPATWRPVCGADGLTYINAERLACANASRASDAQVGVAYLGHCLPNCPAPTECTSSCAYGHQPVVATESGGSCFSCDCAAPPVATPSSAPEPFWCGVGRKEGNTLLSYTERLSLFHTFASREATEAAGFKPLFADPCPTSGCTEEDDCSEASELLSTQQRFVGGGTIPVECGDGKIAGRVCRAKVPPSCTSDADCLEGGACKGQGADRKCRYDCACLERPTSVVYDPLCAVKDGESTTFFNPCLANCQGAWPVLHPGACCEQRLSNAERAQLFEDLFPVCKALGDHKVPRVFAETACPPTLAECQAEPARCCHEDAPPLTGKPQ